MKLRGIPQILTLVLSCISMDIWALPTVGGQNRPQIGEDQSSQEVEENLVEQSGLVNVLPKNLNEKNLVPNSSEYRRQYYHHYQRTLSPRLGLIMDFKSLPELKSDISVGLSYTFAKRYTPRWEIGFDFSLGSKLYLHGVKKWTLYEKEAFRPFYKLGFMHNLIAGEELSSISNYKNYLLYGSIGLEDLLDPPTSVRLEVEAAVGLNEYLIILAIGGAFGL